MTDGLGWRKSSYSSGNGQCVEVAQDGGAVCVRDSKDPGGPVLLFSVGEWHAFTVAMKEGEFDLPSD